jgi:hypothetical protein
MLTVRRPDRQLDDTTANGQLFVDLTADKARGYPDEMKVDEKRNMYYTGPAGPHPDSEFLKRSVDRSIVLWGLQCGYNAARARLISPGVKEERDYEA